VQRGDSSLRQVRQSRNPSLGVFPPAEFAGRGLHLSLDACGVFDFLRKRARTRHDHGSQAQLFAGAGQGQQGGQGFARAASAAIRQGARRTTSRAGAGDGVQSVLTASVCVHPLTFFSGLFARRLAGTPEEGLRFGAARSHESLRLGGRSRGSWYAFRLLRSARPWCLPISGVLVCMLAFACAEPACHRRAHCGNPCLRTLTRALSSASPQMTPRPAPR